MLDLAGEEQGHRRQTGVRVPGDGHPAADGDVIGTELVVKHHGERLRVMSAG